MLAERGQEMTADLWERLEAELETAIDRWKRVADGMPVNLDFVDGFGPGFMDPPRTDEKAEAWKAMRAALRPLRLARECFDDFESILLTSLELDAASSVPLSARGRDLRGTLSKPSVSDTVQQGQLLRITCRQLQRLPTPSTLQQTLHVAASSEADALRERLSIWSQRIRDQDVDSAAMIAEEVADARRRLETAASISRTGDLVTFVGVPIAVAGAIASPPALAAAGIAVAVAGSLTVGSRAVLERWHRWAMYGAR
jgi:hypothetical protein